MAGAYNANEILKNLTTHARMDAKLLNDASPPSAKYTTVNERQNIFQSITYVVYAYGLNMDSKCGELMAKLHAFPPPKAQELMYSKNYDQQTDHGPHDIHECFTDTVNAIHLLMDSSKGDKKFAVPFPKLPGKIWRSKNDDENSLSSVPKPLDFYVYNRDHACGTAYAMQMISTLNNGVMSKIMTSSTNAKLTASSTAAPSTDKFVYDPATGVWKNANKPNDVFSFCADIGIDTSTECEDEFQKCVFSGNVGKCLNALTKFATSFKAKHVLNGVPDIFADESKLKEEVEKIAHPRFIIALLNNLGFKGYMALSVKHGKNIKVIETVESRNAKNATNQIVDPNSVKLAKVLVDVMNENPLYLNPQFVSGKKAINVSEDAKAAELKWGYRPPYMSVGECKHDLSRLLTTLRTSQHFNSNSMMYGKQSSTFFPHLGMGNQVQSGYLMGGNPALIGGNHSLIPVALGQQKAMFGYSELEKLITNTVNVLQSTYNKSFDSTFHDKIKKQLQTMKEAEEQLIDTAVKLESAYVIARDTKNYKPEVFDENSVDKLTRRLSYLESKLHNGRNLFAKVIEDMMKLTDDNDCSGTSQPGNLSLLTG